MDSSSAADPTVEGVLDERSRPGQMEGHRDNGGGEAATEGGAIIIHPLIGLGNVEMAGEMVPLMVAREHSVLVQEGDIKKSGGENGLGLERKEGLGSGSLLVLEPDLGPSREMVGAIAVEAKSVGVGPGV